MSGETHTETLSDLGLEVVAMAVSALVYVATLVVIAIAAKVAKRVTRREAATPQTVG
jgi:hypothetical protein